VFVLQQGVTRGEQKRRGKQIPLDFKKSIGAVVEDFAYQGVDGTDQGGAQNQPDDVFVDPGVEPVYTV
jgi:hypothetical protein